MAGGFPSAHVTAAGGWICFEDEAGARLNGPVRRTWGKAGHTPVLRDVRQAQRQDQHGRPGVLQGRCRAPADRRDQTVRRLHEEGLPALHDLLHRRLEGPVTVVWDTYSSHISKHVKQYAQRQDWLTIIQMPSYAPELNPAELL
uniref:Transposase n=1 Tax=Streptomyces sp. NBC_00180 TaxID=2903632 RepID=A0AAU1I942_9ACTN